MCVCVCVFICIFAVPRILCDTIPFVSGMRLV